MSEVPKESASSAPDTEALLTKINQLEEYLDKFAKARRVRALCSGIGMVLILLLLCLFGWNLWQFGKGHLSPEGQQAFMKQVQADMTTLYRTDSNVQGIIDDFRTDVAPYAVEHVRKRIREELPNMRASGVQSLYALRDYIATDAKDRFETEISDALAEFELELMKKFPDLSREDLHIGLIAMHDLLLAELSTIIDQRLGELSGSFEELMQTLDTYRDLPEAKKLDPENLDAVKLNILESLLDLAIFEVNPDRGLVPAYAAEGGAE